MRLTGRSGKQGVFAISTWAWYMFYTIQEIWILRDNSDKFRFEIVKQQLIMWGHRHQSQVKDSIQPSIEGLGM
jgi:hypothetical protein